jgi:hypothetical protein
MKLVISLVVLLAAGCRSTFYEDARVKVYIDTMFLDARAAQIAVTCTDKSTTVKVGELTTEGSKTVGAVAQGVVSAVVP